MRFRDKLHFESYNLRFVVCNIVIWVVVWSLMIQERLTYGRVSLFLAVKAKTLNISNCT